MTRASTLADYQRRIGRVVEAIEANLDGDLSAEHLAGVAAFSPFHFHRVFRGMVGESVKQHVKRLRLERAAFQLNYAPETVTQVALDAGYDSHEAFTRAFHKRITEPDRLRFDAAVPVTAEVQAAGAVLTRTVPGGAFAVTRFQGPYTQMHGAYVDLVGRWFPRSNHEPADTGCLECSASVNSVPAR